MPLGISGAGRRERGLLVASVLIAAGLRVTCVMDTPPAPVAVGSEKPISRRIARVAVEVFAVAILLLLAIPVLGFGLGWATLRSAIPPSCQEPPTIDYSHVGRPDYGPYAVKVTSWRGLPWSETSWAVVGHGLSVESNVDYGVNVNLDSTEIDRFECRWTDTGVTIVEPGPPGARAQSGLEHFVPASMFLGGR